MLTLVQEDIQCTKWVAYISFRSTCRLLYIDVNVIFIQEKQVTSTQEKMSHAVATRTIDIHSTKKMKQIWKKKKIKRIENDLISSSATVIEPSLLV